MGHSNPSVNRRHWPTEWQPPEYSSDPFTRAGNGDAIRGYRQAYSDWVRSAPMTLSDAKDVLDQWHPLFPNVGSYRGRQLVDRLVEFTGDKILAEGECRDCGRVRWGCEFLTITANGKRLVSLRCLACADVMSVSRLVTPVPRPLWTDNLSDAPACERCGSTDGTERHHWAPRHLFKDADDWPTSNLCRACHQQWHNIVTPNMSRLRSA